MSGKNSLKKQVLFNCVNVVYVQCFVCDQLFGCDGVLHSGKVQDVCGVCDGDGSTCSLTSDSYRGGQAKGDKLLDNSLLFWVVRDSKLNAVGLQSVG